MNQRKLAIRDLQKAGYIFDRAGKNHDIYWNQELNKKIPLKRHDFDKNDRRYINREIEQNRRTKP